MEKMEKTSLLQVDDLRVSFRQDRKDFVEVVKGISFVIEAGSCVALVGESGSGKSVSSLAILGLLAQENVRIDARSKIIFEGQNLLSLPAQQRRAYAGKQIAMIFQDPMSSLNPLLTVGFQIGEVLRQFIGLRGKEVRQRILALLTEVGLDQTEQKIDAYPNQLSGGQQQRVMIAMAIACQPKLLIADEPTTALDVTTQKQIIDLIASLRKKLGMAVLFITHDLALVKEFADQAIVMRHGEIRESGSVQDIFEASQDPYTKALLQCRPSFNTRPWYLPVIDDYLHLAQVQQLEETDEGDALSKISGHVKCRQKERHRGLSGDEAIVLDVKNLSKKFLISKGVFSKSEFPAVKGISFQMAKGKTLGIVGESGSGKTTVGLLLMRLQQASTGQVIFDGQDILALTKREFLPFKRRVQIVFQNPYASLNPRYTVGQILMEPMQIHQIGANHQERAERAFELLAKVGLPVQSFSRYPYEFSGGQRQRIAIARCLTMQPEILICDESVSALDVSIQAQILNLLQDLQDEFGLSYLFISHDLAVVKHVSDQVMVMHRGEAVEMANCDTLYQSPQHPYTKSLLSAIPGGMLR